MKLTGAREVGRQENEVKLFFNDYYVDLNRWNFDNYVYYFCSKEHETQFKLAKTENSNPTILRYLIIIKKFLSLDPYCFFLD